MPVITVPFAARIEPLSAARGDKYGAAGHMMLRRASHGRQAAPRVEGKARARGKRGQQSSESRENGESQRNCKDERNGESQGNGDEC